MTPTEVGTYLIECNPGYVPRTADVAATFQFQTRLISIWTCTYKGSTFMTLSGRTDGFSNTRSSAASQMFN